MNDDVADAQRGCMLSSVVLDDAFEAIVPHGNLTTVTKENFLSMSFSMRFDLDVENPLHVLQRQLLSKRALRRVDNGRGPGRSSCCGVLGDFCIEALADVGQYFDRELRTAISVDLVPVLPTIPDDLISKPSDARSHRRLDLIPVSIHSFSSFFVGGSGEIALVINFLLPQNLSGVILLSLLGFGPLS
jgi:hypothetical protein